jgi:caffeoyl-CoA O-methyltransferase
MATDDPQVMMKLTEYAANLSAHEDDVLRWIEAETERHEMPTINVQPFDGRLLQFLMRAVGARKVVEIGTLAGYSAVWLARALPADGKLFTLEKSGKHAQVARASFARAGLNGKVELLEGPALDSLKRLQGQAPFDFVFIDANKDGYPAYLDWAVEHLRPGGMVAAHNAFRSGSVLAPESDEDRLIAEFNQALVANPRLDSLILPIGDGMAVGIKKG